MTRPVAVRTLYLSKEKRTVDYAVTVSVLSESTTDAIEQKTGLTKCEVVTEISGMSSKQRVLGYDYLNALATALLSIDCFLRTLAESRPLYFENGESYSTSEHSALFGDVYHEFEHQLSVAIKGLRGQGDDGDGTGGKG